MVNFLANDTRLGCSLIQLETPIFLKQLDNLLSKKLARKFHLKRIIKEFIFYYEIRPLGHKILTWEKCQKFVKVFNLTDDGFKHCR